MIATAIGKPTLAPPKKKAHVQTTKQIAKRRTAITEATRRDLRIHLIQSFGIQGVNAQINILPGLGRRRSLLPMLLQQKLIGKGRNPRELQMCLNGSLFNQSA